jgi:hypothetical protein
VVLPAAADQKVILGKALFSESQPSKDSGATPIVGHVVGHKPVQVHVIEGIANGGFEGFVHQSSALRVFGERVTQVTGLKDAPNNIGKVYQTTHSLAVFAIKEVQQ